MENDSDSPSENTKGSLSLSVESFVSELLLHAPPPMKPSHVLFGESFMKVRLISFFPSMKPLKYAPVSLKTTSRNGNVNQNSPALAIGFDL